MEKETISGGDNESQMDLLRKDSDCDDDKGAMLASHTEVMDRFEKLENRTHLQTEIYLHQLRSWEMHPASMTQSESPWNYSSKAVYKYG